MTHAFFGREFTFTQPDGQKLRVRGWGDQNRAHFETLDGFTVVRNAESGFYEIAKKSPEGPLLVASGLRPGATFEVPGIERGLRGGPGRDRFVSSHSPLVGTTRWQQRNAERKAALRKSMAAEGPVAAPPKRHTIGNFVGLCLPIAFPDVAPSVTQAQISDFCNQSGYSGFGNNGSVRDYFLDNSLGKCDYRTVVAPVYTAKKKRGYYTDPKQQFGKRAQELIHEALTYHKANGFDFSSLTADSKGYVYALNVFYAGEVENAWSEGLWPHSHYLYDQVKLASGKTAHDYQITALGGRLELGTYCHENGHMLCDFPDLYDYDDDSAGTGYFCLMSGGNGADESNPTQIGAYLKYSAGWAGSITELRAGLKATAAATGNDFYIQRKNSAEYFIVENRLRSGRDHALPDSGLAIWHVDEGGSNNDQQGTPDRHYECALIQADGKKHLELNLNTGDANDLFDQGTSFAGTWWNGKSTGLVIRDIGAPGSEVSFEVVAGPT